jgi:hypothetical protein
LIPRFLAWSVLTFVLVLILAIQMFRKRADAEGAVVFRAIFLVCVCCLSVSAISLAKVLNLTEGVFEWAKVFLSFAFLYAATSMIDGTKGSVSVLAKSVIITGAALAFIGICQYWGLAFNDIPGNDVVYGTMAHKNLFASAMFLTLPFVLYGAVRFSGSWGIAALVSFALTFLVILMTETRAVLFAMVVASAVAGAVLACLRKNDGSLNTSRKSYLHLILCMCFILVCDISVFSLSRHCLLGVKSPNWDAHVSNASAGGMSVAGRSIWSLDSLNERLVLWKKSIHMIKEYPALGVGLGQWKIVLPSYGKIEKWEPSNGGVREVVFQRPHNDYLWVMAETGFLGLTSYLVFFALLIYYALRICFKSTDLDERWLSVCLLFGIVGYMSFSFFCFPKERIFHNVFLMLIAAVVVSTYHALYPIKRRPTTRRFVALQVPVLLLLGFCILLGYSRLGSEIHTRNALAAQKVKDWERVLDETGKVDCRFYNMDPASTPIPWHKGMANFSLGRIPEALDDFKKASEIHPNHFHALNNLGTCYALGGDYPKAVDWYLKALAISPRREETLINLSVVYYRMGRYRQAYETVLLCSGNEKNEKVMACRKIIEREL